VRYHVVFIRKCRTKTYIGLCQRPTSKLAAQKEPKMAERHVVHDKAPTGGVGWEFFHVPIDDHSGTSEKKRRTIALLEEPVAYYDSLHVKVERMSDNGSCHKSFAFCGICP
jgi:hypothetical protein